MEENCSKTRSWYRNVCLERQGKTTTEVRIIEHRNTRVCKLLVLFSVAQLSLCHGSGKKQFVLNVLWRKSGKYEAHESEVCLSAKFVALF